MRDREVGSIPECFLILNVPANEQTIDGYMELHEMSVYGESEESVSGSIKRKGHSKKSREVGRIQSFMRNEVIARVRTRRMER